MIFFIASGTVVLVAALLIYAATRPDTFRVQRVQSINASPEAIFPLIQDFRNFVLWSPYEQLDPGMKRTYSGATEGKGAVYEWEGNRKAGKGRMEIAHTAPLTMAVIRLDFIRPFRTQNIVEYTLVPQGQKDDRQDDKGGSAGVTSTNVTSTEVTWSMRGPNPYIAKLLQLFISMDRMVGKDFQTGLLNLKAIAEENEVPQAMPQLASVS